MGNEQKQLAEPQLLPLQAVFCGPTNFGTADNEDGCFCDDGTGYIIKKIKPGNPHSSHNEWFCANLALKCGAPVAPFNIIKHTDTNEWFGSQYRIGEIKDWWLQASSGSIKFDDLRDDLSRIYALDLFINNTDRHIKNFLVIPDGASHRAVAIDHGRAWLFGEFPPPVMPFQPCSTTIAFEWLKQNFTGYPAKVPMKETLSSISKTGHRDIRDILSRQPNVWLDQLQKDVIVEWWKDGRAVDRAATLIKGVDDDSLL